MTTALTVPDRKREPARASARCRRAAEHYVAKGCKAIGPSLLWAGYAPTTAREPRKNGFTHDWLVEVARYWNKGSQQAAKDHLGDAIDALSRLMVDGSAPHAARGAAAKTIIDVARKEKEEDDTVETAAEEQARWMNLIRHWKRVFLRRGILLGRRTDGPGHWRADKLLDELNYVLGKGPMPEWWEVEEDGESVLGSEGDSQHGSYIDAEIVAEPEGNGEQLPALSPGPGTDPADPE